MRTLRTLMVSTAVAALAVTAAPFAAQAAEPAPPPTVAGPDSIKAPDGNLYAWYHLNYQGPACTWAGNSSNWGSCKNQATSLWNNGYPGNLDDVWVYWGSGYTGAGRGVYNGVALPDLRQYTFDAGTGRGAGEQLNDNIASHRWVNLP
ncbi:peptidase inhibitor family I36 protein [Streptomyces triculaminicus]|uniref:peptidase inhibitor family I36 protein n=1 Tax=Streptomyces TaxID=1883 RepID=UPI0033FE3530